MKRQIFCYFGLLLLFYSYDSLSQEKHNTFPASVRFHVNNVDTSKLNVQFSIDSVTNNYIDFYIENESEYKKLINQLGSENKSLTTDNKIEFLQTNEEAEINFNSVSATGFSYHTYQSMLTEILALENSYPGIVDVVSLGKGASGQTDVWAVKVSDNVKREEDEPSAFIAGGIHGNERPGPEVVLYVLNHIINNYGSNGSISKLVDNTQMWFIPITNPDGHNNNRRTNNNGVDLNRDFPSSWNNYANKATSQPESSAIVNSLNSHHFVLGLDLHTHGQMVMYPWAHTSSPTADHSVFLELGNMIGSAMGGYRVDSIYNLFGRVLGGSLDYEYGQHGIIALGEELGTSHSPAASTVENLCRSNLQPALNFLGRSLKSTLTGIVEDATTGASLEATIYIPSVDSNAVRNKYKSKIQFGRYYRLLPNGTYSVKISAPGYESQTHNVSINGLAQTQLDVQLQKEGSSSTSSTSSSNNSSSSSSTSSSGGNSCSAPIYRAGTQYPAGTIVQNNNEKYLCNVAGWCSSSAAWAYEPGAGLYWQTAWASNGTCGSSNSSSSNSSSSSSSSSNSSSSSSSSNSSSSSSSSSTSGGSTCSSPLYRDGRNYNTGEIVQNTNKEFQCKIAGWCSIGGPYAPGLGWASQYAWDELGSCDA